MRTLFIATAALTAAVSAPAFAQTCTSSQARLCAIQPQAVACDCPSGGSAGGSAGGSSARPSSGGGDSPGSIGGEWTVANLFERAREAGIPLGDVLDAVTPELRSAIIEASDLGIMRLDVEGGRLNVGGFGGVDLRGGAELAGEGANEP